MSKVDKTSILPIFNHSRLKAVPGQKSFSSVSHIFLRIPNAGSSVNPCSVVQKDGLKFVIYNGPVQEMRLLLPTCL